MVFNAESTANFCSTKKENLNISLCKGNASGSSLTALFSLQHRKASLKREGAAGKKTYISFPTDLRSPLLSLYRDSQGSTEGRADILSSYLAATLESARGCYYNVLFYSSLEQPGAFLMAFCS